MKAIYLTRFTTVGAKAHIISQDGQVSGVKLETDRDMLGVKRQVSADWPPASPTGTDLDSDGHILSCEKKRKRPLWLSALEKQSQQKFLLQNAQFSLIFPCI